MSTTASKQHMPPRSNEKAKPMEAHLTAMATLSLLSLRLSRIEHAITGRSEDVEDQTNNGTGRQNMDSTVTAKLHQLETQIAELKRLDGLSGSLVRMVDSLRREYPEVFTPNNPATLVLDKEAPLAVRDLSLSASQVLSHASLYMSTSSRLQTLQALRIPPAAQSASLVDAGPRLQALKQRQAKVDADIDELKSKSAGIIEWWMSSGVVGMGELFEDWETRIQEAQRIVRWEARRRAQERGEIG